MNKNKLPILIGILSIIFLVQCKNKPKSSSEYDELERITLEDKIIWNENTKLKWKDFKFDSREKSFVIYAKVGLSARYNVNNPILFRTNTTFSITESIVADTTNIDDLRIAQAKFDLLETYRRKMVQEVDSIRSLKIENLEKSYFDDMLERYYDNFEEEWKMYRPITVESLENIEMKIEKQLE
jgi:hypothetical protein